MNSVRVDSCCTHLVHADGPEQRFEKLVPNHRQHAEDDAEDNTQPHLWQVQSVPGHTCEQSAREERRDQSLEEGGCQPELRYFSSPEKEVTDLETV